MKRNTQLIEKRNLDCSSIDLVGIFKTIQGEGPFSGQPAIFIRLAGCNLQCPGCDTDYTTDRRQLHASEIIEQIVTMGQPPFLVVITGGEPFRQDITALANGLFATGYRVQIETNGTLPPSKQLHDEVYIVCSPKTGKINEEMQQRMNALKYVMSADSVADDGLPIKALDHSVKNVVARPPAGFTGPVYLQPMDGHNTAQNHRNVEAVKQSCLTHGYILQLQIHKIIGVE